MRIGYDISLRPPARTDFRGRDSGDSVKKAKEVPDMHLAIVLA